MKQVPRHEQGAALINVLVLVGVLAALATGLFDRMRTARHLDAGRAALDAARSGALAAETLLLGLPPAARPIMLATPAGPAVATITPGGNCFNLNSVAQGPPGRTASRPLGIEQLARLLGLFDVPADEARRIGAATADWIDIDNQPNPGGAEDPAYARAATPYRTAGNMLAEVSEWRAVAGVTPALYAKARPHMCALPEAILSRPNLNSITAANAPVIAAIADVPLASARAAIAARPPTGWGSSAEFWAQPLLAGRSIAADALRQPDTRDQYRAFRIAAGPADLPFIETGLIAAATPGRPARLLVRRWGEEE
jgi:general secretion pathway protein K